MVTQKEKIVMGMVSGDYNKDTFNDALNEVCKLSEKIDIGGVFNWEYFDAPDLEKII